MAGLSLWCPRAERVEVVSEGERWPMRREGEHFFSDRPPSHGQDYALSLDGGEPLPDPRSPWQPQGVHGPSRWLDHDRHRWDDEGFSPQPLTDAILYELHVGTFTPEGTLDAAIDRLDHLVDLGVTHVELLPVAAFPGQRGWGYDGVALFAPHRAYGGPDALKRFVDACHGRGLAVILDVVYNHLGPEGNYLERFGPYFSWRHRTPWGKGLNLDEPGAAPVRQLLCDNAAGWIRDYHIDGLRLDATHALVDSSAIHILEQIASAVGEAGRARGIEPALIAEHLTNDPRIVRPVERHGLGMQAQWCDDFHHALHAALTSERQGPLVDFGGLEPLAHCLSRGWWLDGRFSAFRRRHHGRPLEGVDAPGHELISYCQNHDQLGNRAQGERLHQLAGLARARIAAALTLLGPGVPMIFMGEEWAASAPFLFFTDFTDRRLGEDVRAGRARELAERGFFDPPDPQKKETFRRSVLDWSEVGEGREMIDWYRTLIRLRRDHPSLRDGTLAQCRHAEGWLAMQRGPFVLGVNLGEAATLPIEGGERLLASPSSGRDSTLPQDGVALWRGARLTGAS